MIKTILNVVEVVLTAAEVVALVKFKKMADEAMAERIKHRTDICSNLIDFANEAED